MVYLYSVHYFPRSEEDGKQKCKEYWDDERELTVTSATRSVNVITSNVKTLDSGLIRRTLCIAPSNKTEVRLLSFFYPTSLITFSDLLFELVGDRLASLLAAMVCHAVPLHSMAGL